MRKVLVVDDEFLVRVGIKSFLNWEENGYTIIAEAADGKQALEIMERELPDVVLTDLKMDGMDGFELIQVSRKRFPTVQFVVLSSFEDGENVKRAMKLGAADYIFKLTSKPEELLRILNDLPYEQPENEAEKLLRKNRSAIKQRLIRMAAQKSYPYRAELQEEFRQMGLKTEFQKPYCVLLSRFSREIHEKDSAVLRYAMENMTQEVFEGGLCTETYPYTANSILVIVQQTGSTQPVEQIRRAFSRLYEYAARYLGLHLEGCLSTVHTGMEQFPDALTECEMCIRDSGKRLEALVDCDDVHCLMIGASGVGKTAFFLYPNIEFACACGMSFLILDTKGDLARNCGRIAQKYYGYRVSVVDLRNPIHSDRCV